MASKQTMSVTTRKLHPTVLRLPACAMPEGKEARLIPATGRLWCQLSRRLHLDRAPRPAASHGCSTSAARIPRHAGRRCWHSWHSNKSSLLQTIEPPAPLPLPNAHPSDATSALRTIVDAEALDACRGLSLNPFPVKVSSGGNPDEVEHQQGQRHHDHLPITSIASETLSSDWPGP